jgi:hypothetical protein
MLYFNPGAKAQAKRVLLLYGISKTLPYKGPSNRIISLGNSTYILVYGVAKGALVKRGYFLNRRKNYKGEGN